jgi:hypothetical protein
MKTTLNVDMFDLITKFDKDAEISGENGVYIVKVLNYNAYQLGLILTTLFIDYDFDASVENVIKISPKVSEHKVDTNGTKTSNVEVPEANFYDLDLGDIAEVIDEHFEGVLDVSLYEDCILIEEYNSEIFEELSSIKGINIQKLETRLKITKN